MDNKEIENKDLEKVQGGTIVPGKGIFVPGEVVGVPEVNSAILVVK